MISPYAVRLVLTASGERLPTLVSRATGVPDFDATLWVTTSLRPAGLASETIAQALRSVAVFLQALPRLNIEERLRDGQWLSPAEISTLGKAARQPVAEIDPDEYGSEESTVQRARKVVNLEKLRSKLKPTTSAGGVKPETALIRIGYIRQFLWWRIVRAVHRARGQRKQELLTLRSLVDEELSNQVAKLSSRSSLGGRMGLNKKKHALLLSVIQPNSPQNPWQENEFISYRNELIVSLLLATGLRRGELLGLRVGDLRPQEQKLYVFRRPDDAKDPRLSEPNVKTRDKVIPLSAEIYQLIKRYLISRYDIVRGKHDFLVVAHDGAPLSKSALNRVFSALQQIPDFVNVSPHILRHTWAENLAEAMHKANMRDETIHRNLELLGGWAEGSNSVRRYTKRFAQEQADVASMNHQQKLRISRRSPDNRS